MATKTITIFELEGIGISDLLDSTVRDAKEYAEQINSVALYKITENPETAWRYIEAAIEDDSIEAIELFKDKTNKQAMKQNLARRKAIQVNYNSDPEDIYKDFYAAEAAVLDAYALMVVRDLAEEKKDILPQLEKGIQAIQDRLIQAEEKRKEKQRTYAKNRAAKKKAEEATRNEAASNK